MLQKKRMEKCKVNPNLFLSSKLQINYRLSVKKKRKKENDTLTNLLTGSACTSAASVITFIHDSISLAVSVQK